MICFFDTGYIIEVQKLKYEKININTSRICLIFYKFNVKCSRSSLKNRYFIRYTSSLIVRIA